MKPAILGAMLLLFTGTAYAQVQTPDRFQMIECEGINNCISWTFQASPQGWKGYAKWRTGEEAVLDLSSTSDGKVVIQRTDVVGRKQGLTATYKGSINGDGDQLGGEFKSSYQGVSASGNWYAVLGTKDLDPPNVLHFCGIHCLTFNLENPRQLVNHTNLPGQANERRVLTVERFTYNSVIIHRVDTGSHPLTHEYIGRMTDDGNGVNGGDWTMTWGGRLNDLPKDDQERDRRSGKQQFQAQEQQQLTLREKLDIANTISNGVNAGANGVNAGINLWNFIAGPRR
ncbi:MAG TPA: hypothetical protein VIE43_23160 [Thermoanaerobaculia bacterium]|nr:hypothetical protein [Thermoanaerobaculia bacterium]